MTESKGKSASDLFPDLVSAKTKSAPSRPVVPSGKQSAGEARSQGEQQAPRRTAPPPFPDISWLKSGEFKGESILSGIPTVLVLVWDEKIKRLIAEGMKEFNYQIEYAQSEEEAIQKLKQLTPEIIIFHADSSDGGLEGSRFHRHVTWLPMAQRRKSLYILVGSQFETMYDLQALIHSANLVIKDQDMGHVAIIIRKGLQDYNKLFGSLVEAYQLQAQ